MLVVVLVRIPNNPIRVRLAFRKSETFSVKEIAFRGPFDYRAHFLIALLFRGADIAAVAARTLADLRQPGWATPTGARVFAPLLRRAGIMP